MHLMTIYSGNKLMDMRADEKRKTGKTYYSRKGCQTIRNLSNGPSTSSPHYLVNVNQVSHQPFIMGKGDFPVNLKRPVITLSLLYGCTHTTHTTKQNTGTE